MATIPVKDANNATVSVELPLAPGRAAAAASRPVVLSNEDKAILDTSGAKVKSKYIVASGTALTRPANTTPYTAGDSVSDNATAGSVTANVITVADANDAPLAIERFRLETEDTGIRGKAVRVWLYRSDPTANSGVVAGDNAAFSNKRAGFVGSLSGTFSAATGGFSDGGVACLVPDQGSRIICKPGTGAQTIWWQLQALEDFTPSANSTTFTPTVEGFQGGSN